MAIESSRVGFSRGYWLLCAFLIVTTSFLCIDQFAKGWAFATERTPEQFREIVPGLYAGAQGRNYGAMLSLEGEGSPLLRWSFTIGGFIAIGIVLRWAVILDHARWRFFDAVAGGLVLAGMLSNQIDRLLLGYVRDFLVLQSRPFEIFNGADVFMILGAGALMLSMCCRRKPGSASAAYAQ